MLTPDHFFDLSKYAHRELFEGCNQVWQALGNIASYLKSQKLGRIEGTVMQGAYLQNPELISIGEGSVVEPGAYIKGPCIIGKGCEVRQGAYIRGDVICGDSCIIGHATEMKNCILLYHAYAGHFAYVGDSILGNFTNLGAGVKCANLRLKGDEVLIGYQGEKIPSGRRKLGAIVGDYCQIGCNAVLNPGTVLSKRVDCFPGLCVDGYIEENSRVLSPVKPIIQTKKA